MPRQLIKKFTPDHEKVKNHKHLQLFGKLLHDPNLFHLNRRSVSGAFFVGLLWAFIPVPMQMIGAAATAIPARVNLPISVALVWLTNPITIPPIFYFTYRVGLLLMGKDAHIAHFKMNIEWIEGAIGQIWQPLFLGSLVVGLVAGTLGYVLMRGYWRWHVVRQLQQRKAMRESRAQQTTIIGNPGET